MGRAATLIGNVYHGGLQETPSNVGGPSRSRTIDALCLFNGSRAGTITGHDISRRRA
jgi:hypothetical protein